MVGQGRCRPTDGKQSTEPTGAPSSGQGGVQDGKGPTPTGDGGCSHVPAWSCYCYPANRGPSKSAQDLHQRATAKMDRRWGEDYECAEGPTVPQRPALGGAVMDRPATRWCSGDWIASLLRPASGGDCIDRLTYGRQHGVRRWGVRSLNRHALKAHWQVVRQTARADEGGHPWTTGHERVPVHAYMHML